MENILCRNENENMTADSNLKQIGNNFVREYYTTLSKFPHNLSKYYKKNSIFVHHVSATETQSVVGQKDIHDCILQLDYKGCSTNIISVNTQNLYNYIVISVVGELTKRDYVTKNFSQTIVLDHNNNNEYIIKNNMFFYSDDIVQNAVGSKIETCTKEWRSNKKKIAPLCNNIRSPYPPISHQLFVSGIPANIKPQDLRQFFEKYGQLYSLRIMKKNVNYGFITFAKSESTQKVLQSRPILFPDETGVWLVVKEKRKSYQDKDNTYLPTSHQLFIGDIPDNVTSDDLKHFFNIWGNVVNARIMVTEENPESATEFVHGFVTFVMEQSAKAVLQDKPILFPNENGIEFKVMEKICRQYRNKNIIQNAFQKNENDNKSIFVCF